MSEWMICWLLLVFVFQDHALHDHTPEDDEQDNTCSQDQSFRIT